jgi:hypothetical protein
MRPSGHRALSTPVMRRQHATAVRFETLHEVIAGCALHGRRLASGRGADQNPSAARCSSAMSKRPMPIIACCALAARSGFGSPRADGGPDRMICEDTPNGSRS